MTGLEYVKAAMRLCGVLDGMETPKGEESDDALNTLNRMMRSWSTEIGPIFSRKLITHTLTAGTFRYTIGLSLYQSDPAIYDDIVNYRPMQILNASIRSDSVDYPLKLISFAEYQTISNKSPGNQRPEVLAYNSSAPSGVIYLFAPPDSAYSLRMTALFQFQSFALATDTGDTKFTALDIPTTVVPVSKANLDILPDYSFPPGYDHAIVTGLAELLGVEYGIPIARLSMIQGMAVKAKTVIKTGNIDVESLRLDPRLPNSSDVYRSSFTDFQAGW